MEPIRRALASEITATGKLLRGFIPYNSPAKIAERGQVFTEVIRRGAFARALGAGARDVLSTFNHDVGRLLGRTSSGTLRLADGPDGLRYEVDLPDSAADVRELLARGDLKGSSFTALPLAGGILVRGDTHELVGLDLVEIGPVVLPAYTASDASVRSAEPTPAAAAIAAAARVRLMERS